MAIRKWNPEICRGRSCHDWGNGPGVSVRLSKGESQICADCGLTRKITDKGTLQYVGRLSVEERN